MIYIQTIILGLVQGLTEFLPVSSSGHLAIFKALLPGGAADVLSNNTFDIFLHLATLVSVFLVFWADIKELIKEFFAMIADVLKGKYSLENPYRKMIILIIIATIPAVIVGGLFDDALEAVPLIIIGFALLLTAILTYFTDKLAKGRKGAKEASYKNALVVGLFQACALVPGLSRSGSTVFAGVLCGFDKKFAVKFSFIMSIPAILGAAVLQIIKGGMDVFVVPEFGAFLVGAFFACISGILAIRFLVNLLAKNKFYIFSIYCLLAGITSILLFFF